jgi:hypothetical protein
LASNIEHWLLTIARDRLHPQWQWGLDLFWLSFIAAHPDFPAGEQWPNADIPFDGIFLAHWLERLDPRVDEHCSGSSAHEVLFQSLRDDLWAEFERQIGLFT